MRVVTAGILLFGLAAVAGAGQNVYAEERGMSTGAATHCLGRYLVDLPRGASVGAQYTFADAAVQTLSGVDDSDFRARVQAREAELKRSPHATDGSLFVGHESFDDHSVSLASWQGRNSQRVYHYDMFSHVPQRGVLYRLEGKGNATEQARSAASQFQRELLQGSLRYRPPGAVPEEPGFCIDSGFIARSRLNKEKVTADIRLREYPGVTITFMSYVTGKPDRELLERASSIPPGYEEVVARMTTLRAAPHAVGPVRGQELLVRGDGDGKTSYEFLWEYQGEANSLARPFLSLQMSTTAKSDESGEVIDAPFESDQEAIATWNGVLDTLRIRPGAVGR